MKQKKAFNWKQELIMGVLIFFMAILTYCLIIKIWKWDLQVPFNYYSGGDITGILSMIKNYVNGESLKSVFSMSAPFGTNRLRSLFDASLNHGIIWILARLTKSVGYTINIFYILTFGLSAVCAYTLLRKLNMSMFSSLVCGMIYAFIPGAILRGQGHIFVGSIFVLPLSVLVMIYLMRGEFCKVELRNIDKLSLKETIRSVDKKLIWGIVVMTLLSLSTVYYAVFAMILLTFALIYVCLEKKQVRHIYYYLVLVASQILICGAIFVPQFLNTRLDESYRPISMVSRSMSDVETYGLKLAQLFLPISNHRISLLARLRNMYDINFLGINENGMASIGTIMSIGAIIGALCVFYNLFRKNEIIMISGKMIVFSIIVAVVGGLASFVGMVTYSIRCYNRFSFFIGCFALIIVATILDIIIDRIVLKVQKDIVKRGMYLVVGVILIVGAVLDQTPRGIAYDETSVIQLSERYFKDKKFVEEIESLEDGEEMILVLPMETMFGYTTTRKYINYDTHLMYLHSDSSSWSTGGNPGEAGWRWLRTLANSEWENILTTAAVMGYSGIALYTNGYAEEEYIEIQEFIVNKLGPADVIRDDGDWEYYSLGDFTENLKLSLTQEKFSVLKEYCSQVIIDFYKDELYCTEETPSENHNTILVKQDAIQYGPYTFLDKGEYMVTVRGENLTNGDFYVNLQRGTEQMDIEMLEVTGERVTYSINLSESKSDVEFCCQNIGEDVVAINSISIYPYTKEYIEGYKVMEEILDNQR